MPLTKPPPVIVRQTMQSAFKELESTITAEDSRDFHSSTLLNVRKEALDIETRLAARQSLRNMRRLMPLFTALEHYSKVVDVLCNGTPFLPWIWAPITLILRIASEYVEAFEQLVKGYARIATSLQRFEILGNAFSGEIHFQQTLAIFYAEILEFHKHAYKFVRRGSWRLLFLTSWGRFQRRFENILEDMKRHEALIDQEASARNIAEARDMRQELRTWKEESLESIRLEDKQQSAKEFHTILSWLRIDESHQLAIFEAVSSQGNRHPGTCSWIHQNTQIRAWLQERTSTPILWLSGTAGSGKSVISTQLINFMSNAKRTVLHHFCTHSSSASSEYDHVLKSLLQQVLRQDTEWTAHVYNEMVLKRKTATIPILEQLLRTILTSSSETPNEGKYIWIVLDGVDELREGAPNLQSRLLSLMKQLPGRDSTPGGTYCKVLISSRSSPTISQALGKKPKISLTEQKKLLTKAIGQYSQQRLGLLGSRLEQLGIGPYEVDEIGHTIAEKSDGMFLYARLVLDYLSTNVFIHREELRDSIKQLPKELSEFYRKIVVQILAPLDTNSVEHIKCILGWLAFSKRPLKKHELLSAVAFSSGNPDIGLPAPEYILNVCGSLIEERSDATFSFIHISVNEYLQSASSNLVISKERALQQHCLAAVTCLLSSFRLLNETCDQRFRLIIKGLYEFQVYASEHWTEYLLHEAESEHGLPPESQLYNLLNRFSLLLQANFQHQEQDGPSLQAMESRLYHLQRYPLIYDHVKKALQARSLERLQESLKHEDSDTMVSQNPEFKDPNEGVSALLACYQAAIVHILHEPEIPGVPANELESFRTRSRTSAYTCRLRSCPRTTLGFDSTKLRDEHEVGHARRYSCTYASCQYPAFFSSQALKRHTSMIHNSTSSRKTIRQKQTPAIVDGPGDKLNLAFSGVDKHLVNWNGSFQNDSSHDNSRKTVPRAENRPNFGFGSNFDEWFGVDGYPTDLNGSLGNESLHDDSRITALENAVVRDLDFDFDAFLQNQPPDDSDWSTLMAAEFFDGLNSGTQFRDPLTTRSPTTNALGSPELEELFEQDFT